MASLFILTGPRQGSRLALLRSKTVLGRDTGCGLVIDESVLGPSASRTDSVSRRHAVISCVEGDYYVEDGDGYGGKSRNGTYLNDQRLAFPGRVRLHNNDRLRICDFRFEFHDDAEPEFSPSMTLDHDSDESIQAQPAEKLRIILEIGNSLSTTLEIDALLPRIVENLFQLFSQAERGFILLRDEATAALAVRAFKTRRPGDGSNDRYCASIVRLCMENVQAVLGDDLPRQFPDSDSVTALSIRSLVCAPLWSREGQALGAVLLDASGAKPRFTQEDLNLLLGVANQASIALCNARLHREALAHQRRARDMELAHEVQKALLPHRLPEVPGYAFHAYYQSAQEIGGDYYDFIPLPGGRLAVLLGDVAGKGVAAALVMARFSVEARVCLERETDLSAAVGALNAVMLRAALADRFVTLAAAVLDPATHAVTLVNAGHLSPLLVRRAGGAVEEAAPIRVAGPVLGVFPDCVYGDCSVELRPGDGLFLFSDGVTDALDARGRAFRTEGIRAVLAEGGGSLPETGERLIEAVKRHAQGCSQNDDVTLVCFGRTAPRA